ncbi:hypothetical protein IRJ41_017686 [Triplophysa rosa]|uniref:Uncharacterized protein n=1 Tax=Triplophysa rosa TaxID=992332 RepID=A0A9W7TRX6_TRIRA|nr:hypothetical protein IRJ41_017686 [Triplophysa rosa]
MSEDYNSHTSAAPSAPLSLSPDQRQRDTVRTPPGLSEPKIVEISELRPTRTEEGIKAFILMRRYPPNVGQTALHARRRIP